MHDKWQEVEIKLHTPDLKAVGQALNAAGATLARRRVFERNIRYDSRGWRADSGGRLCCGCGRMKRSS